MAFFNSTQRALAQGRSVLFGRLYFFDFDGAPTRAWDGWGTLVFDSHSWLGKGDVGADSEINFGVGDTAGGDQLSISGVNDQFVELARNSEDVRGRLLYRYGLFFGEDLQPLDDMFQLKVSIMDRVVYAANGPNSWTVTLQNESLFVDRNGSAYSSYSDRDQQALFPGDLGLSWISKLANTTLTWPRAP